MRLPGYISNSLTVATIGAILLAAYFWDKEERNQNDGRQHVVQEDESVARQSPQPEQQALRFQPGTAEEPKSYLQRLSLESQLSLEQ